MLGVNNLMTYLQNASINNKQNYIYQILKERILSIELQPGQKISEPALAKEFNCSRSPIREALSRLQYEGLVHVEPKKETTISKIDSDLIIQSYYARCVLEYEILIEIISTNRYIELSHKMEVVLSEMESILTSVEHPVTEYLKEIIDIDNQFHQISFEMVGRTKVFISLQIGTIHYKRFQFLYLQRVIEKGYWISMHKNLKDYIKDGNINKILEDKKDLLYDVKFSLQEIRKEYPNFFE